ncbi:hypothetical protein, variant 4 [Exophiala mesophila]|uniref:F-box domain-containing protein n=1 Tax=Exophiala mesophila TaxID=212818 RepID=A0A0D1XMP2_EXOME|nr:uncharacterized protein PV10_06822 [Exophiala mesophila]XP_016220991.1 hypothetical protein, variant 1 [Exophiala mesophila]XP_016220992.1 hypothetical protein, variant 2 [Exophiala mesophila]XP_016220993.1 hypothetical protein, variant 3 [Exophiala mesophila]XP_016220994.1 hypothetical protein, variant 4 [Exophiala mesophila]KIV89416.1 hypothetical protein PV10_06822 [Exophiala mesophila]KIV89417.1 hypothetical protein, variant 1 [Exophiala mesophila]KIV89418.1 hypothetical protein, vari
MANPTCPPSLEQLPNEILVSILTAFDTRQLLPWVVVSRQFHSIILRILHFRLLLAAALPDCKLILEAYHPSRNSGANTYLYCTYLGTDGLSSKHEGEGSLYQDCLREPGRFAKLGALYSRFRPEAPSIATSIPLRRIAGAVPSQTASGENTQPLYADSGDGGFHKIHHVLNLDPDELFVQFCVYPQLVRFGPRRGVFLSSAHIVQHGQGVMRVWKQWLQDRALEPHDQDQIAGSELPARISTASSGVATDKAVLWTDYKKNVGLRVAVRTHRGMSSVQSLPDHPDTPMSFIVEIKELVVRTTHLMLAVESFVQDQDKRSGKALIFGNFASVAPYAT